MESKSERALKIVQVIAECIRESGSIISGHLYACVMSEISFNDYESALGLLKRIGLIAELEHELFWIGANSKGDNNERRV